MTGEGRPAQLMVLQEHSFLTNDLPHRSVDDDDDEERQAEGIVLFDRISAASANVECAPLSNTNTLSPI